MRWLLASLEKLASRWRDIVVKALPQRTSTVNDRRAFDRTVVERDESVSVMTAMPRAALLRDKNPQSIAIMPFQLRMSFMQVIRRKAACPTGERTAARGADLMHETEKQTSPFASA